MSVDLSAIVASAFSAVGSNIKGVLRPIVYRTSGAQTYDPATGATTTASVDYPVKAIITAYKRQEKEATFQGRIIQMIQFGDQKCMIPYASLPLTPDLADLIVIAGVVWKIADFQTDPTGAALHTFQIRLT